MKTFEEKWTAWLDGQLSGRELSEFEASLPDKAAADAEKADAKKLGELLKRELGARTLTNRTGKRRGVSAVRPPRQKNLLVVDNSSPVVDRHCVISSLFGLHGSRHAEPKADRGITIPYPNSKRPG